MFLGFVRQFPDDLSRLLDALHAIHRFAGPERHRVERPGGRLVGDERVRRVHGTADIRSPRLGGLTDELPVEPLDRLDTGTQDAMGRVRPVRGERLGEDRVLRFGGDELVDVRGMGPRLLRSDEPSAYPDRRRAGRECRRHGPPGADPASGDDGDLDGREDVTEERQQANLPPDVARRRPSRIFATYSGGAAPIPLTIPSPPASATAAARAGEAILPIPACCNGTVQPSNSVNFVWSIATP